MSTDPGVWIAAFLTLGIFSFLYRDNPYYKLCESIFIGISAGYWFTYMHWNVIMPKLVDTLKHAQRPYEYLYVIAGILGVMMLCRLFPRIGWISRWPLAFVIGLGAGLEFITYLQSNVMNQLKGTVIPLNSVGNVVIVVGVICGLIYFFFSVEHRGVLGGAARVGIWFLMVSFGASFGYTVMARISLLIGRLDFLFGSWLGVLP